MEIKHCFPLFLVFSLFFLSVEVESGINEEKIKSENPEDPTSGTRESRQMKWFQPSSFTLNNLKKSGLPADDDGRLFKLIHKGSSMSSTEMLANIIKKAIEDLNDQFERFGETFAIYVQNEIEIAALTPDPTTIFSNSLSQIINNASQNTRQVLVSLIGALSRFLGIDLQPLIQGLLGDTTLGGLPFTGTGIPTGLLGGLLGPTGLLTGPVLGK
ncbi:UNVERIFIED_CONTAM: hypothetical protein RMT77_006422 [Armadillidium vulgare]